MITANQRPAEEALARPGIALPPPLLHALLIVAHPGNAGHPTQVEVVVCGPDEDGDLQRWHDRPESREVGWTVSHHGELDVAVRAIS